MNRRDEAFLCESGGQAGHGLLADANIVDAPGKLLEATAETEHADVAEQDDESLVFGHHVFGGADKLFSHASS